MSEEARRGRCFIARPVSMHEEHRALYGGDDRHWEHVHERVIAPAVRDAGYEPIEPTTSGSNLIHADIISNLNECELVLADLSTLNPNVLFEAGVRTSINKPLVLIAEKGTSRPFDVGGVNILEYDPALVAWGYEEDVKKLTAHIKATQLEGNALWRGFGVALQSEQLVSADDPTDARIEVLTSRIEAMQSDLRSLTDSRRLHAPVSVFAPSPSAEDEVKGLIHKVLDSLGEMISYGMQINQGGGAPRRAIIDLGDHRTPQQKEQIAAAMALELHQERAAMRILFPGGVEIRDIGFVLGPTGEQGTVDFSLPPHAE